MIDREAIMLKAFADEIEEQKKALAKEAKRLKQKPAKSAATPFLIEPATVNVEPTPVEVKNYVEQAKVQVDNHNHVKPTPVQVKNVVSPTPVVVESHNEIIVNPTPIEVNVPEANVVLNTPAIDMGPIMKLMEAMDKRMEAMEALLEGLINRKRDPIEIKFDDGSRATIE